MPPSGIVDRRRRMLVRRAYVDGSGNSTGNLFPVDPLDCHFLAACGREQGTTAIVVSDEVAGDPVAIPRPFVLIGTADVADVRVSGDSDDAPRGMLVWTRARWYFCDFKPSENARRRDGLPVGRWLGPHGMLDFGRQTVQLVDLEPASKPSNVEASRSQGVLEQVSRDRVRDVCTVDRSVALIGRHATCKVCLDHDSVADFQAGLVKTSDGVWIVDLSDDHRLRINNERVRFARLNDQDVIDIGEFRFRMRYEATDVATKPQSPKAMAKSEGDPVDRLLDRFDRLLQDDLTAVTGGADRGDSNAARQWFDELLREHVKLLSWVEAMLHEQQGARLQRLLRHREVVDRLQSELDSGSLPDRQTLTAMVTASRESGNHAEFPTSATAPRKPR